MHSLDVAPFVVRLGAGALAGAATWVAAWDVGSAVVIRLTPRVGRLACGTVGAVLGMALLGSVVALLALAHGLRPLAVALLPYAILLARSRALARRAKFLPDAAASIAKVMRNASWMAKFSLAATIFAILSALIAVALPAVWWDPIAYHLPIAANALRAGAFTYDVAMPQTAFPLLVEAAALPAYAAAGSAGAATIALGFGIVLALLCAAIAAKLAAGSLDATLVSAALVTTSGLWIWLAPSFYVDVPVALFVVAALAVPLLWPADADLLKTSALCGMLAGSAGATKYPGLADAVVAGLVFWYLRRPLRPVHAAAFAVATIAIAGGWYARTFALTGDFAYPLFTASFGHVPLAREFAQRYIAMTRAWCGGGASVADVLLLPWRMLVEPRQYCGDPGYALRLGAVFFASAFVVELRSRTSKPMLAVLGAATLLTAIWFAGSRQDRFIVPAMCFYAVAVAAGAAQLRAPLRAGALGLLVMLGTLEAALNWLPPLIDSATNSIVPAFRYIAGTESAGAYLDRRLESFAAASWVNAHVPAAEKIIALDDVRNYYFGGRAEWANPYYQPRWSLDWSAPAGLRYRPLAAAGIRIIVVNANPVYVGRTPTGIHWGVLARDVRAGIIRPLYAKNGVTVYGLNDPLAGNRVEGGSPRRV